MFPARAGMNRRGSTGHHGSRSVPRPRGDEPHRSTDTYPERSCSPPARGCGPEPATFALPESVRLVSVPRPRGDEPARERADAVDRRVFPARAGMNRPRHPVAAPEECSAYRPDRLEFKAGHHERKIHVGSHSVAGARECATLDHRAGQFRISRFVEWFRGQKARSRCLGAPATRRVDSPDPGAETGRDRAS